MASLPMILYLKYFPELKGVAMRFQQHALRGLLTFTMLFSSLPLWSQSQMTTGTIEGTVVDETGAVVSGATVTLTHVATGSARTLSTDASGRYTAPLLSVGNYQITAHMNGFNNIKRND